MQEDCERVEALLRAAGATEIRLARDEAERQRFWAGRKNAFPAVGRISPDYYCMDGTIPRRELAARAARASRICRAQYGLQVANVFHAGDGNMHPLILFDANAPGEMERAEALGARILELCVAVGGSITGEHGVGREKINQMCAQFNSDELMFFHARQGRVRPRRPAQSRQERADPASLRRVRLDACASRRAALPRTGALLMRRDLISDGRQRASRRRRCASALAEANAAAIRGGDSKAFLGRPVAGRAELDTRAHRGIVQL